MQEGKSAGLGAIAGAADTYWGKNKGRSMEGALVKSTKFLAIAFIVISIVLNQYDNGQCDTIKIKSILITVLKISTLTPPIPNKNSLA